MMFSNNFSENSRNNCRRISMKFFTNSFLVNNLENRDLKILQYLFKCLHLGFYFISDFWNSYLVEFLNRTQNPSKNKVSTQAVSRRVSNSPYVEQKKLKHVCFKAGFKTTSNLFGVQVVV